MIVQIYEISTPAEAHAVGAMGVDHIGVLVGEGSFPREQTIEQTREIFAAIPAGSKASALSLSHDVELITSDGSHTKDLQKVSALVKAARGPNCATK